ncbi:SDR family NAD(P)-dependent oxidoreductase [Halosolutus gelatinilyticus]|uniref:SDR family NAD(P)-dependent oxidoreductase n=1 Tax=Halosolutus gelatinilyticus TaxID=2931975 RepID=UPI001FF13739|nr:SDR family NAD(P)-dependent oxidoreductase [Halosolutus gelatinilyticus]
MGSFECDFSDETVIVTGGSSGIGRAVAERFGDAGATVIVADIREAPKGSDEPPTHETIRDGGGTAEFVATDVSESGQVESVVDAAREFGGVDVMVNNAGIFRGGSILETDVDEFDAVYGTNVRSVFVGCRAAAADMLDREGGGAIINTASISSELAQTGHAAYDASKGAVMMLTRVAALELAWHDIRVNAVAPGAVQTAITSGVDRGTDDRIAAVRKENPMDRRAAPEEIAGAYCFLAGDDASYITGHMLYVDGGYAIY